MVNRVQRPATSLQPAACYSSQPGGFRVATDAEDGLMRLLLEIFADNVVTADERDALLGMQADLAPASVRKVFGAFVRQKWGEALADGVVTDGEKLLLQRIVEELELPDDALPTRLRLTLRQ